MARIRSIKPEFWTDRKLSRLSRDARLLYIALWNQADEWGRVHGDTRYVKGHCLPYDDDLSLGAVDRLLDELATAGHLIRYAVEGDPYLVLPKLHKHQRLEPVKVPSRLPEPPSENRADTSERRANESARDADESEPRADTSGTIVALQVAGSRLQVAGSRDCADSAAPPDETEGQRVNRLATTYTDAVPLSNFAAVAGVVRKAVKTGLYDDRRLVTALRDLAQDGRSVTTDSLRYALDGMPQRSNSTTAKVQQTLALGEHFRQLDSQGEIA